MEKNVKKYSILFVAVLLCVVCLAMPLQLVSAEGLGGDIFYNDIALHVGNAVGSETINYTSRNVIASAKMAINMPMYSNQNFNLSNSCAATAGANIIGFYDYYLANLMPNFEPTIIRNGVPVFKGNSTNSQDVINDLFVKMKINQNGSGTTKINFYSGLNDYAISKGYTFAYESIMTGTHITEQFLPFAFNNNYPLAIFMNSDYIISDITVNANSTVLTKYPFTANHILVAYGFEKVQYFDGSNCFREDIYLKVSTGIDGSTNGYVLVGTNVLDMTMISIY